MAYTSYEITANNTIKLVQEHCRHLTEDGEFTVSSKPTLATVELWITETYHDLNAHLAAAGYTIAVTDAEAIGFLERLNVYGTVLQVELSHPITGRRGRENDRYQTYRDQYDAGLKIIAETDALSALGAAKDANLSQFVHAGGTQRSEKDDSYKDKDILQPRFPRGFGRNPRNPGVGAERLDNVGN